VWGAGRGGAVGGGYASKPLVYQFNNLYLSTFISIFNQSYVLTNYNRTMYISSVAVFLPSRVQSFDI
jgi:hypothetical protein